MGDSRITHIPFRDLERMGLWVIDSGDGGQDADIGEPAVDAADQALRVVSASGHSVYDSQDDSFPAFYQAMQAVLAGKAVRWRSQARSQASFDETVQTTTERLWVFAQKNFTMSCARFARVNAFRQSSWADCFAYTHGQALQYWNRHQTIELSGVASVESKGESTNLRTMDTLAWSIRRDGATFMVEDVLQNKRYPVDDLTAAEQVLDAIRTEHRRKGFTLTPTAWGFQATLHGVPIRIWLDPTAHRANQANVISIMAGLARIPPSLLRLVLRFRIQQYREPFVAVQCVDSHVVARDIALLQRRMQSGMQFAPIASGLEISFIGIRLPLLQNYTELSSDAAYELLEWYAHFLEQDGEGSAAQYMYDTGRIEVTKAMTSAWAILHELGHMVEHALGADFSADVVALFGQYMEHVLTAEAAPAPVRAAWARLHQSTWEELTPTDRATLQSFLAQAATDGSSQGLCGEESQRMVRRPFRSYLDWDEFG